MSLDFLYNRLIGEQETGPIVPDFRSAPVSHPAGEVACLACYLRPADFDLWAHPQPAFTGGESLEFVFDVALVGEWAFNAICINQFGCLQCVIINTELISLD